MRLWFINFDGTVVPETKNRTAACLDSSCDTVLRSLSEHASDQVVIVSNRSLDDIAGRIAIPGAILGGCNGIEWQLSSGYRIGAFRDHEEDLKHMRAELVSGLYDIISGQGVVIEDRLWSIAVHAEKISRTAWHNIVRKVSLWAMQHGVIYYCRQDEIDVQMIRGFNRSVGISYLVRQLNIDPLVDSVIYVGYDEGDVAALWWTKFFGGTAIIVGDEIAVPGAIYVKSRSSLAAMIEELASEL